MRCGVACRKLLVCHHFTPLAHWGLLLCKPFQCWIILRNRVPKSNRHAGWKQRKILICYCQQSADFGIHHRTPLARLGATTSQGCSPSRNTKLHTTRKVVSSTETLIEICIFVGKEKAILPLQTPTLRRAYIRLQSVDSPYLFSRPLRGLLLVWWFGIAFWFTHHCAGRSMPPAGNASSNVALDNLPAILTTRWLSHPRTPFARSGGYFP